MADETLTVRALLEDEISNRVPRIRRELDALERSVNKTNRTQTSGAAQSAKSVDGLSKSYSSLNRMMTSVSQTSTQVLGQLGTRTAQASAIGLGALTAYGLKASSSIEGMKVSLNTMFGPDEGRRLFGQLQSLANYTPFTTQQQVGAAQILSAYGLATDQVVSLSKAISDIASASTNPADALNSISLAIGQIQARGKVAGQEIMQLANNQVPALQLLAQMYGTTTVEIQKFMDAGGQLPAAPFLAAVSGLQGPLSKFQGLSKAQSETLRGTWSTFTSLVQQDAAQAFEPVSSAIKQALVVNGQLNPEMASAIHVFFGSLVPGITDLTQATIKAAPSIMQIAGVLGGETLSGLARLLNAAAPGAERLAAKSPEMARGIERFFDVVEPHIPDLVDLTSNITELALVAIPALASPLAQITGGMVSLANANSLTREATTLALGAVLGWRAVSSVVGGIEAVRGAIDALTVAEQREALASKAGLLGKLGLVVGAPLAGTVIHEGATTTGGRVVGGAIAGAGAGAAFGVLGGPFAGISVPVGAAVGGVVGGIAGGLTGDVGGNLARSVLGHQAASAMTPGTPSITSGVRNWGLASGSSGHRDGTALDVAGPWMASYVQNVRRAGGWASLHDNGSGQHAHTEWGDAPMAARTTGRGGGGDINVSMTVYASGQVDMDRARRELRNELEKLDRERTLRG